MSEVPCLACLRHELGGRYGIVVPRSMLDASARALHRRHVDLAAVPCPSGIAVVAGAVSLTVPTCVGLSANAHQKGF